MRIPTLDGNRVSRNALPAVNHQIINDNSGAIWGDALSHVGRVVSDIEQQERQKAITASVTEADTSLSGYANDALHNPDTGALNSKGKAAFDLPNKVLPGFDQQIQKTLSGISDPRAKQIFSLQAQQRRVNLIASLNDHEAKQRTQFYNDTFNASIDQSVQSAGLNYTDPKAIKAELDNQSDIITAKFKQDDAPDEQISAAIKSAHGATHAAVIDRMVANDQLDQAKIYLKSTESELTAEKALHFTNLINAAQRSKEMEAKRNQVNLWADMAPRVQDTSAAYLRGLDAPNAPTLAELRVARPDDADEIYASLQKDRAMGKDMRAFALESPDKVVETVNRYNVESGGVGAKDSLARQDEMRQAAEQSLKERRANPVRFAVDNQLGWHPITEQNMFDELAGRELTLPQVNKITGVNSPLLSPEEAKGIGKMLEAKGESEALQYYDALRASLSPASYKTVLSQLAPDSPITAYAGIIYGKQRPITLNTPGIFTSAVSISPQKAAETMLKGERLINKTKQQKDEDGKPVANLFIPPKSDFDAKFATAVGDSFAGRDESLNLALQAAYDYYVGKNAETGELNKSSVAAVNIKPDLVNQAIKAVVGNVVDYHGRGSVITPLGMDESTFQDKVQSAFIDTLKAHGFSDADIQTEIQKTLPNMGLRNYLSNQYMLTKNREPFSIVGKDGKQFAVVVNIQ